LDSIKDRVHAYKQRKHFFYKKMKNKINLTVIKGFS